jgi:putative FmdB family regulatory protein
MPIYEFYCKPCHTIYQFFSTRINTEKIPVCPHCGYDKLERRPSLFATPKSTGKEGEMPEGMPPLDEARMEKAMAMLSREAQHLDEEDPKQAAQLMRKLTEASGLKMGAGMEEALARLEKGEDPDQVEAELGDLLEEENPFQVEKKGQKSGKTSKPRTDDTLYDLE